VIGIFMTRIHYISLAVGFLWLTFDIWIIVSNVSLRETPLGVIANYLDMLPSWIGNPIYLFLWFTLLLGWIIVLVFALKPLLRRNCRKSA
jgi:hypothetical protein